MIPLIPRKKFFGNPDHLMARLSPNGQSLAYIAPYDGVLNVWVAPSADHQNARTLTFDQKRGIHNFAWTHTNEYLLYTQDQDGDENWHLYCVNLKTQEVKDLTPYPNIHVRVEQSSRFFPQEILIGLNNRVPEYHDLYRLNVVTGELALIYENNEFAGFLCDDQLEVRFAFRIRPDGSNEMLQKTATGWSPFLTIGYEDILTTSTIGFGQGNTHLYMIDSRGRDTAALVSLSLLDQSIQLVAEDPRADVCDVLIHPTEKAIQGAAATYERKNWQFFDEGVQKDLEFIRKQTKGDLEITSRSLDDQQWIVCVVRDDHPTQYYHFNRAQQQLKFLFSSRQSIEGLPLCNMIPVTITARDGLKLVCYLTIPRQADPQQVGRPKSPLPMVLCVHGGPQARDGWGWNPLHQWLANRGYAVLSVNFRGSTGFGKNFINMADGQWSRKMHEDLIDAVQWAIQEQIADPHKIGIMGGSYGGYATLVGLTYTPDVFACGVDIVGPSNLATLLSTIPPYWKPIFDAFKRRIGGDPETPEGKRELEARSPLFKHEHITKPLLIGQGANDPRVKQAESDQIVAALKSKKIPVTYVLYPDEGHGFARPENRMSFNAITEAFLAAHLGGLREPINDDFQGSSLKILEGGDVIRL